MAAAVREGWNDRRAPEPAARESNRGGEASTAVRKQRSRPLTYKGATGGVFKNAAVRVLRHERRLMSTGEVTKTAVRMGFIGSLPGKTPEATMASALYTDIKRWKAGIPGSVFCRPREGLFGLREWSSDPELAVLVASEKDDPFFKPGHVGPVRRRSDDAASDESDASRDERRFSFPPRDSRDSPETKTKTKLSSRKGKRTRLEPGGSSDDEEGLRLLLDAAVGMNGEAEAPTGGEKKDASDADARMTKDSDPSRDDDASFREKTRVRTETETETEKEKAAWGDVSLHASAPPSASDAAAAEARRRHLDGVVQTLSARCAELYVLLGPHQIVARELAVLIVALRGGGARYALQEKIVTEQLWELTRALAFPGGLGETPETRAALARVVAASVDEAATVASASIAEAAAMSLGLGLAAHREQVERRVEAQVEAHANAARILAATTMRTSAEGRGGTAGDNHATAASRLLAGARSALDGGASASASAYAALAAASAAADTARTTLQPTLSPPP